MNKTEIQTFANNAKNGSVDAWLANKKIEFFDKATSSWVNSSYPDFHELEYRIKEPKYRPLTAAEMTQYINKFITKDDNEFIQVAYVGSHHIAYYIGGVLHFMYYESLMSYHCDGTLLRKEIEE